MCGFAGFLQFNPGAIGAVERRRILERMSEAIAHRGPDDAQFYDDGVLSLVFRRLAIVDTHGGRQPLFNESKDTLLVANAEIYNHADLRRRLEGAHPFATQSDCEVALHAYAQWGTTSFELLRGMFAMVVWEVQARRLTLVRDRLGIKPLYVCHLAHGILFGSELKALLAHPSCPRGMDMVSAEMRFTSSSRTPTYVRGVDFLPAGTYLQVESSGRSHQKAYWDLTSTMGSAPYGDHAARYVESLRELILQSTREHLQGSSSVAMHLSGGLDSAMLASIVARTHRDTPCFTVVERTTYLAGDVDSARHCAQVLGLPWYPVLYDYRNYLDQVGFGLGSLEDAVWMMNSPHFDLEWFLKEQLTRCVRRQRPDIKVLMLGQGADEFAGGYSNRIDAPRTSWSKYVVDEIEPWIHDLLVQQGLPTAGHRWPLGKKGAYHFAMELFARQLQAHNLWHEDRTSSWHSMEARVPFLDHRIVELFASIPSALHESLLWNKTALRQCMQSFFPAFDSKRVKVGFCTTADTRSTDILVHNMATRATPDFLAKYLDWEGFPFDRKETLALAKRVRRRDPGFYGDSYLLLNNMCTALFKHQLESTPACNPPPRGTQLLDLTVVDHTQWPSVASRFVAEPVMPTPWCQDDLLGLPTRCEINCLQYPDGKSRFSLVRDGQVLAEMEIQSAAAWIHAFVRNLGKGMARHFTIQDWVDESDISQTEFETVLNFLHQSGFVVRLDRNHDTMPAHL